jgi:hypothetical protein
MAHTRVLHVERGFHMSRTYAEQVMRDHCTITWDIPGETIRDTTDEERIALRADQAQQKKLLEPLAYAEISGIKFKGPLPIRYDLIRAAHDLMPKKPVKDACLKAA